jgi:hypothetical protein
MPPVKEKKNLADISLTITAKPEQNHEETKSITGLNA